VGQAKHWRSKGTVGEGGTGPLSPFFIRIY